MDPWVGYALLGAGVVLYGVLAVWLVRSSRGGRKSVRARSVSGQVVVADRVEGGVTQHQAQPAPGRSEEKASGKVRKGFDWVKLILGIVATILSIAGAILKLRGGS